MLSQVGGWEHRMRRLVGIAVVALAAVICAPVLAQQGPMSPIVRTTRGDQVQSPASKASAIAPATKQPPAVPRPERDDPVAAPAVIPPPLDAAPAAAVPAPSVKRHKR